MQSRKVTSFLQVPSMGRYHPAWYNEHLPQQIHIPGTRAWLGRRAIASISRRVLHISLEPSMLSIYSLFQPEKSRYYSRDFDLCVSFSCVCFLSPLVPARYRATIDRSSEKAQTKVTRTAGCRGKGRSVGGFLTLGGTSRQAWVLLGVAWPSGAMHRHCLKPTAVATLCQACLVTV